MTHLTEGSIAGNAYFIKYDEDLWFALPSETRQKCKDRWIELATPLGVHEVVLQLIPDELFPANGKEQPYVYWRHKLSQAPEGQWAVKVTVVVTMDTDPVVLTVDDINKFKSIWPTFPMGTRFCLNSLQGVPMMEHTT